MSLYVTVKQFIMYLLLHTDLPEPDDLFAAPSVVSVDGAPLPVCQVDLLHTTQHHLEQDTGCYFIYLKKH